MKFVLFCQQGDIYLFKSREEIVHRLISNNIFIILPNYLRLIVDVVWFYSSFYVETFVNSKSYSERSIASWLSPARFLLFTLQEDESNHSINLLIAVHYSKLFLIWHDIYWKDLLPLLSCICIIINISSS